MSTQTTEPTLLIAAMSADSLAGIGYAFVEDEKIEEFAQMLDSFFSAQRIPTFDVRAAEYLRKVQYQIESLGAAGDAD